MRRRKWSGWVGWTAVVALLSINLLAAYRLYSEEMAENGVEQAYDSIEMFTQVMEQVRRHYPDVDRVQYQDLVQGAIRGMLGTLDDYSQFMEPRRYEGMKEEAEGQFGGLGVVVTSREGVLKIISAMENTPGHEAGLMAEDVILEIDGNVTDRMDLQEVVDLLRGAPGTKVTVKILRPQGEIKTVEIVRSVISLQSVMDARIIRNGIGYVRITQFASPTAADLESAVDQLLDDGMEALVLDLRSNPGGLLNSAVSVSELFLQRNDPIVFTQGRSRRDRTTYFSRRRRPLGDFPLVVLINGGSASASEIVAGALQDNRRAILLGEKTFGKGSVQTVMPMSDGSALRLTTALYYTPSERVIHEHGIAPDIEVAIPPEDWQAIRQDWSRPAIPEHGNRDKMQDLIDGDAQLRKALHVLEGIKTFMEARHG